MNERRPLEPEFLEPEGQDDDFAFMVMNPATGEAMRIYSDGQIDGFPLGFTVIQNRIPELVSRAASLGYQEATLRIADARRQLFMDMIGEFRKPKGLLMRWWPILLMSSAALVLAGVMIWVLH